MHRSNAYEEVYSTEDNPREGATMMKVPSYRRQSLTGRAMQCRQMASSLLPPVVSSVLLQEGKGSLL